MQIKDDNENILHAFRIKLSRWAGAKTDIRSSRNPCHETYVGRSPWTEPETRALRDFVSFGSEAHFVVSR